MGSNWVMSKVLGSGSNGIVYLAESRFRCLPDIAVKSTVFSESSGLQQEKAILDSLKGCPEIVSCYGSEEMVANDEKYYNLFLEYASGGTLADLMKRRGGKLSELEVKLYTRMILKGLCYIHSEGYVHCDIKPTNILVFPSLPSGVGNCIKIADFGNSKKAGIGDVYVADGFGNHRCTPLYTSPESVKFGFNEAPLDIWSLGCIMVEMFTGKRAWSIENVDDLLFEIGFGKKVPDIPLEFSENAKDFVMRCLVREPYKRWTAKMLLNHPFMVDENCAHQIKKKTPQLVQSFWSDNMVERKLSKSSFWSDWFSMVERKLSKLSFRYDASNMTERELINFIYS